jgi:hypothetical protein
MPTTIIILLPLLSR